MTSYLLLRSNKESGPHTFEQLLGYGLKPYDLVWVNGKSAAWRYPSEIEELKPYAPGDVEQPFDRFFKKPVPQDAANSQITNSKFQSSNPGLKDGQNGQIMGAPSENYRDTNPVNTSSYEPRPVEPVIDTHTPVTEVKVEVNREINVQEPVANIPQPDANKQYSETKEFSTYEQQYLPKKSVYVTMPERKPNQNSNIQNPGPDIYNGETQKSVPSHLHTSTPPHPHTSTPSNPPTSTPSYPAYSDEKPTITITENPETAKIKYSQPLDEIKDMYVKTLQDRKERIARQVNFKVNLKRVAVVAGLIGIGLLAGYVLKIGKSNTLPNTLAAANNPTPAQTQEQKTTEAVTDPTLNSSTDLSNEKVAVENGHIEIPTEDLRAARPLGSNQAPAPRMDQPVTRNQDRSTGKQANNQQLFDNEKVEYSPTTTNDQTGERSRTVRTDVPETKTPDEVTQKKAVHSSTSTKNALGKQVSVSTNDYKRVAFGGIRNLELTVTNNSKYELDNVLVELEYIKPNEETLKTDTYRFTGIAPSEASTIRVPDTNRGIRVQYRILSIGSRQFNADIAAQ